MRHRYTYANVNELTLQVDASRGKISHRTLSTQNTDTYTNNTLRALSAKYLRLYSSDSRKASKEKMA